MKPDIAAIFEANMPSKVSLNVILDSEIADELEKIQTKYKQSRSDVINRLLCHILLETEKKTPKKGTRLGSKKERAERNLIIYGMHTQGMTFAQIAAKMNLSPEYIRQIVNLKKTENDALVILEKANENQEPIAF